MKDGVEKQVKDYIGEVGLYSKEHRDYLEKLSHVLDEMKESKSSSERNQYNSFRDAVSSFEKYITDRKIELTRHEKERFAVIASSGLGSLAKKRMAEDLMRTVRERYSSESEIKIEEEKKKNEIAALSRSHFFFTNWYRLFRFALDYGTITLFTHLYRASTLDLLRVNFVTWHRQIENEIFMVLDEYYYYLSSIEYNSIVKLAEAGNAAERFNEVKKYSSYDPAELYEFMEDFTSRFICVIRNVQVIDRALKKVFRDRQPAHGFMGFIGFMTDRPLQNNVVMKYTGRSIIRNSICGALFSFYTSHFGVPVKTFNQLMYLAGEDGIVDSAVKNLTQGALQRLNEEEKKRESDDYKNRSRLDELLNLTKKYSAQGEAISEKIYLLDRSAERSATKDQYRPLYRIVKILEGYIKYIIDPVAGVGDFTVEYESDSVENFFSRYPALVKAAGDFINFGQELQGSRGKDVAGFRVPPSEEGESLVQILADTDRELPRLEGARQMRETLSSISSRCYNLCMRFNDIIAGFNNEGRNEPPDSMDRFDFAVNSRIRYSKIRAIEAFLGRKNVSLMDFIETGCSIGFYIADYFGHKGIRAVRQEIDTLQQSLQGGGKALAAVEKEAVVSGREDKQSDIAREMDRVYLDSLTGLRKWEYFEDFILPVYYDDKACYNGNLERYVFCCEISNLDEINRKSGNDAGDIVFKKFAAIVNNVLADAGSDAAAFRSSGGIITGFFNGISQSMAAEHLYRVLQGTRDIPAAGGEVLFSSGLYREWAGSSVYKNIEVAKKIMLQLEDGIASHAGFLRNQEYIVTDKDFDRRGMLKEGMISVLL
ncbi:MAG TPA: diguanylate cyclase [Spirochaetota bacterium]|nr:diguanylate cyclase [Spirochaetota bacterium]HQO39447.1 diguanylate cyclase [Spirochaetota bacterium]